MAIRSSSIPGGEVLLDMGQGNRVDFAEVELEQVAEVRARVPSLRHRRPIGEAGVR